MSLKPCSVCHQRQTDKLTSVYWSWQLADRSRRAYKQDLCAVCFEARVLPTAVKLLADPWTCPSCGQDAGNDADPTYADVYVPRSPKHRMEIATCGACAVAMRAEAIVGAELLPDRQVGGRNGAAAPNTMPPAFDWHSVGIEPNA